MAKEGCLRAMSACCPAPTCSPPPPANAEKRLQSDCSTALPPAPGRAPPIQPITERRKVLKAKVGAWLVGINTAAMSST